MKTHIILKSKVWVWEDLWLHDKVPPLGGRDPKRDRVSLMVQKLLVCCESTKQEMYQQYADSTRGRTAFETGF